MEQLIHHSVSISLVICGPSITGFMCAYLQAHCVLRWMTTVYEIQKFKLSYNIQNHTQIVSVCKMQMISYGGQRVNMVGRETNII